MFKKPHTERQSAPNTSFKNLVEKKTDNNEKSEKWKIIIKITTTTVLYLEIVTLNI